VALDEIYLHTKWHLDPSSRLATVDMGRKVAVLFPFLGGAGFPSLQCRHTYWHLDPSSRLATTDTGRNWAAVPLFRGVTGSPCNTMWPEPRPTPVPTGIFIHAAIWSQYIGQNLKGVVSSPPFWGSRVPI